MAVAMMAAGIIPARGGECQGSARAVWSAHPGSHATWRENGGRRCWFVGYGRHHHVGLALRLPPPAPLPPPRPKRAYPVPVTPRELPAPPPAAEQTTDMAATFSARFGAAYGSPLPIGWGWR